MDEPKVIGKLLYKGFVYFKSKQEDTTKRGTVYHWDCNRVRAEQCTERALTEKRGKNIFVTKGLNLHILIHQAVKKLFILFLSLLSLSFDKSNKNNLVL